MTTKQSSGTSPTVVHTEPPPVRFDQNGRYRVGQTRVLLDMVVHAFDDGATPEQIVQNFDSLSLAEVHSAIAYYLRHRQEITEYLRRMDLQAEELRRKLEREGMSDPDLGRRLKERFAGKYPQRDEG